MKIISVIKKSEVVNNKNPNSPVADLKYYPCYIIDNKDVSAALFTEEQISIAIDRAKKNLEDIPKRKGFFASVYTLLFG